MVIRFGFNSDALKLKVTAFKTSNSQVENTRVNCYRTVHKQFTHVFSTNFAL